eukprot:705677_1
MLRSSTNYGDIIKLPDPEEGTDGEEYPVIEMFYDEPSIDDIEEIAESIEIVGNIFSNNKGRSIVFTDSNDAHSQERWEHYNSCMEYHVFRIHHNIFKNKNGRVKKESYAQFNEKPNPNQIAFGIQDY